jgi:hypothetical protein
MGTAYKWEETMPALNSCIVCGSPNVFRVVDIPPLPIDTNRLWASRADARAAPKARLILAHCNNCGHVFNCNYNDDLVTYEVDYENSQIFSPRFRRYAEELADSLIRRRRAFLPHTRAKKLPRAAECLVYSLTPSGALAENHPKIGVSSASCGVKNA